MHLRQSSEKSFRLLFTFFCLFCFSETRALQGQTQQETHQEYWACPGRFISPQNKSRQWFILYLNANDCVKKRLMLVGTAGCASFTEGEASTQLGKEHPGASTQPSTRRTLVGPLLQRLLLNHGGINGRQILTHRGQKGTDLNPVAYKSLKASFELEGFRGFRKGF